jgi:hypothetical protein
METHLSYVISWFVFFGGGVVLSPPLSFFFAGGRKQCVPSMLAFTLNFEIFWWFLFREKSCKVAQSTQNLTENLLAQPLRPKLNALKSSGIFVS